MNPNFTIHVRLMLLITVLIKNYTCQLCTYIVLEILLTFSPGVFPFHLCKSTNCSYSMFVNGCYRNGCYMCTIVCVSVPDLLIIENSKKRQYQNYAQH